jgi:hypothetical protein
VESQSSHSLGSRVEPWIALVLCAAVLAARAVEHLVRNRPAHAETFAPYWLPLAAVGFAAAGIMRLDGRPQWLRVQRALLWSGLLLMVWAANGLPLDLLRLTPLMPPGVDWPRLATKTSALAAAVVLARLALARPAAPASTHAAAWYGYAAFVLALPYPVLRTHWALGGTLGLMWPGAAGPTWAWLACIPWLLAAALSLLLVPTWRWMPRRLLLAAGWFATAVVAMMGPAACWALLTKLVVSGDLGLREHGIAAWVPGLFYGSWLLWAIAAGAATRSYQLRSAALRMSSPT